jgi:hypothetical protein
MQPIGDHLPRDADPLGNFDECDDNSARGRKKRTKKEDPRVDGYDDVYYDWDDEDRANWWKE